MARKAYYNRTNTCDKIKKIGFSWRRCGNILEPYKAYREYNKKGDWTGKWWCDKCHKRDDYIRNISYITDRRAGNLSDSGNIFGDKCQKLTCKVFEVDDLNKENNNYRFPIDHSSHFKLGILETKGVHFNRYLGAKGGWIFKAKKTECEMIYDNMILWCIGENGKTVERGYIVPKEEKELDIIRGIGIIKYPSRGEHLYDKYRIKDAELIQKANKFWEILK